MRVDFTRPIRTNDGRPARYLGPLAGGMYAVAIDDGLGHESLGQASDDGGWIENVPEPEKPLPDFQTFCEDRGVDVRQLVSDCLTLIARHRIEHDMMGLVPAYMNEIRKRSGVE